MSPYSSVYEALKSNVTWRVRVPEHYKPVLAVYIFSNGEVWTVFPVGRPALNCSEIFPLFPSNLPYASEDSAGNAGICGNGADRPDFPWVIINIGNGIWVAVQENLVSVWK